MNSKIVHQRNKADTMVILIFCQDIITASKIIKLKKTGKIILVIVKNIL